jgi:hypothetical protein
MIKIKDFQYANPGYNELETSYLKEAELSETLERKNLYLRMAEKAKSWKRIPIGYWHSKYEPNLPFPKENSSYLSQSDKDILIQYLTNSNHKKIHCLGHSECRICDKINGSLDIFDGKYIWPEGLSHYIEMHDVELPDEFVEYCITKQKDTDHD